MDYLIPRFLCALLAGAIISQCGSLIQMSTRNILASPSTLGFDGLGVLWVLIIHSFLLILGHDQPILASVFFGIPVSIIIGWVYSKFMARQNKIERLILTGLTFNLLVGAIFSFWQFLFLAFNLPFPIELWFGHFRFADLESLIVLGIIELLILIGWFSLKKEFLVFSLGKSVSKNLHLAQSKLYLVLFICVSLGTFAVISLFGAFSFLGLIFPIIARRMWFTKFDLKGELIIGALVNGFSLMAIDVVCYYFPIYGAEVPVGLIATGVGAVSLILILWQSDTRMEILAKSPK